MPAQVGLITCPQQNQIAHAATLPTLAENARMGQPQWERRTQRSLKVGHPLKALIASIDGMLLPFRTKISCMSGEYSAEWAELRRLRRRVLTVVFAGAAIFVLVPFVSTLASHTAAKVVGLALFAAWAVVLFRFLFVSGEYVYWSCPRCGKPFHYVARWYGRWNNPFARRCVHCGLPKWVDSDPDPKLKRELDSSRSDSIFKLADK